MYKLFSTILTNKTSLLPKYRVKKVGDMGAVPDIMGADKLCYVFDKDDTLVPLHQFHIDDPSCAQLLARLKSQGKYIIIVSNSVRTPDKQISYTHNNTRHQIPILVTCNKKPYNSQQIEHHLLQHYPHLQPHNTVIIGDRVLTDIVMGNSQGWTTVLVDPVEPTTIKKHGVGVWLARRIEKGIIWAS